MSGHHGVKQGETNQPEDVYRIAMYTESCIAIWVADWKENGWVRSNGEEVANRNDWIELDQVIEGIKVKWVHVDSHKGIDGNEVAGIKAAHKLAGKKGARLPFPE